MLIRLLRNALGLTLLSTPFVVCTALVAHINRTRSSNMPIVLTVPSGYGYVGLAATGALWLTFAQGILVGKARKQAKIAYPAMYAEKAEAAASRDAHIFK